MSQGGHNVKNLIGLRFKRLVVTARSGSSKSGHARWICKCDCGQETFASSGNLRNGNVGSCGCLGREVKVFTMLKNRVSGGRQAHFIHGYSHTPTYNSWRSMMKRVLNPSHPFYHCYGGANPPVTICERWHTFENFLADMGKRPDGTTLGRTADVGPYQPGNVQWQTDEQQKSEARKKRLARAAIAA